MSAQVFRSCLEDGAQALGIALDATTANALTQYFEILAQWNRTHRLVGDASARIAAEQHFLDALALLPLLPPAAAIHDLGSGAGFPGAVLAAALPMCHWILVEPLQKRVAFLNAVRASLALTNIELVANRSVAISSGSVGALVSRAALPPALLMQEAARLLRPKGWLAIMTARGLSVEEWEVASSLGFVRRAEHAFSLPFSGAPRHNLVFSMDGQAARSACVQ